RHLARAFRTFFAGCATSPTCQKTRGRQAPAADSPPSAFRWNAEPRTGPLAKRAAPLAIRWSPDFTGTPRTVTRSPDPAGRSFVSFLGEEEIAGLSVVNAMIGGEVGLNDVAVLSTGQQIATP